MRPPVRLLLLTSAFVLVVALTIIRFYSHGPANVCGYSTKREREAALRLDLLMIRHAIDSYTVDEQELPESSQDLVDMRYLKNIPIDPFTCKNDWVLPIETVELGPNQRATGIVDVHSSSNQSDRGGAAYSTW